MVTFSEDDYFALKHYGKLHKSGRYPWGSGGDPYQNSKNFKSYVSEMTSKGMTKKQIAEAISEFSGEKITTRELVENISISTESIKAANISRAVQLKDKGYSTRHIGKLMGDVNESTVRGWLKKAEEDDRSTLRATADVLKNQLKDKPFLDVGKGNHLYLGVSATKFNTALGLLQTEGYPVHSGIKVRQLGTDHMTYLKVLCNKGVSWHDAREAVARGDLSVITAQSDDGGRTFRTPTFPPLSISSKKIDVRYGKAGKAMDGVIELRPGVPELDLGANHYAQVRIAVDGTHYLKGMAIYAYDLKPGTDIRFNTPKDDTGNKLDAMKPMKTIDGKIDIANPFGASTYPHSYIGKDGKEHQSILNPVGTKGKLNIEGRWDEWANTLSSQFLSKQPIALASAQLREKQKMREDELNTIMNLTNPVVKRKLLQEFADAADADAVHLKAASFPRQSNHVLLPMNSMRPGEIYAPNFKNGEYVALVRHPHAGPFEIPVLRVNNLNRTAKKILGGATDAVGIHHSVAAQLSGADFDGDAVLVIPTVTAKVKSRSPLAGLQDFDPQRSYPKVPGMKIMTKQNTQTEMGKISNLITDMTIKKASDDEIARAVRHSMVVIDAEKHELNYKQSEKDNGIAALKKTYQAPNRGASTIISRASAEKKVPQIRRLSGTKGTNPDTGEKVYERTNKTYTTIDKKTGKPVVKEKMTKGTQMEFVKDAHDLVSTHRMPMEEVYAGHANTLKAMANQARKADVHLTMPGMSKPAKAIYAKEVASLEAKLKIAQRNAPRERRAQVLGNALFKADVDAHPEYDKDQIKKAKYRALNEARIRTDAKKDQIHITDREWEAIQAGAIGHSKLLTDIFPNSDMERIKELATPRHHTYITPGQMARARQMKATGRSMTEIAAELGIPRSTLAENLAQ